MAATAGCSEGAKRPRLSSGRQKYKQRSDGLLVPATLCCTLVFSVAGQKATKLFLLIKTTHAVVYVQLTVHIHLTAL